MNFKNEDILIQGNYYAPKVIDVIHNENKINDRAIGSNANSIHEPNAFCKCIDELIGEGKLHTKEGVLIGRREGNKFYDNEGKLIKKC